MPLKSVKPFKTAAPRKNGVAHYAWVEERVQAVDQVGFTGFWARNLNETDGIAVTATGCRRLGVAGWVSPAGCRPTGCRPTGCRPTGCRRLGLAGWVEPTVSRLPLAAWRESSRLTVGSTPVVPRRTPSYPVIPRRTAVATPPSPAQEPTNRGFRAATFDVARVAPERGYFFFGAIIMTICRPSRRGRDSITMSSPRSASIRLAISRPSS